MKFSCRVDERYKVLLRLKSEISFTRRQWGGKAVCFIWTVLEGRKTTLIGTVVTICKEPCDQPIPTAKSTPCQSRTTIAEKNKCHFLSLTSVQIPTRWKNIPNRYHILQKSHGGELSATIYRGQSGKSIISCSVPEKYISYPHFIHFRTYNMTTLLDLCGVHSQNCSE